MLGWFKKKFKEKEKIEKIPVAERPGFPIGESVKTVQPETVPEDFQQDEVTGLKSPAEETQPSDDVVIEDAGAAPVAEAAPQVVEDEPEEVLFEHEPEIMEEKPETVLPEPETETETEIIEDKAEESLPELESSVPPPAETPEEEPAAVIDQLEVEIETEPPAAVIESTEADTADLEELPEEQEADESMEPDADLERVETVESAAVVDTVEHVEPEIQESPDTEVSQPKLQTEKKKKSLFSRLTDRLARTRESFTYQLDTLFLGKKEIDADLMDDLEELLITADLGFSTTEEILDHARRKVKRKELSDPNSLKQVIQEKIKSFINDSQEDAELVMPDRGPFVIMVVGVNGVGKTTTIGKIANKFVQSGQSVLLVAADTFRAAAISQLKIWGERNNVPVASQDEGSDPSSVVFDAIAHANAKQFDVVLVDTAGRLHTQANLMEELKKIKRVIGKQLRGAPHEVLLVIDATTGQNGISQAKLFDAAVDITGIALTKLDGTAKGGIVANISRELKTPIRFIGIGETIEDLRDFDPDEFVKALFQTSTTARHEDNA